MTHHSIKLGFSANAYLEGGIELEDTIKRISKFNYEGIEIIADRPHTFPKDMKDHQKIKDIRDWLSRYNLAITNLNANTVFAYFSDRYEPSFISRKEEHRELRIQYTKDCIDLASELEVNTLCVLSGRCLPIKEEEEKAWEWLVEGLQECISYIESKDRDIKLLIEPHPEFLVERSDDVRHLIGKIESKYLGINFDINHSNAINEDVLKFMEDFKDHINHFHISDGKKGRYDHLIPGDGDINFKAFFNKVREIRYSGFLTVELYTYAHDPDKAAKISKEKFDRLLGGQ